MSGAPVTGILRVVGGGAAAGHALIMAPAAGATHLEGAQAQFKHQPLSLAHVLGGEGEDRVVDPKEGDEQQGGAGQPPGTHARQQITRMFQLKDRPDGH